MPIRIEKDEPRGGHEGGGGGQRGGGGGNPIALLMIFLAIFIKRPKLAIALLIIGGAFYMLGGGAFFGGMEEMAFSKGCTLSQEMFDKAEVFEPLSTRKTKMPERVSLQDFAPRRKNQGQQGSCVGWATAYSARTILHAKATGEDPDDVAFSPAFLYNQIALQGCQGSYMLDAMKSLKNVGAIGFNEFKYDERSCSRKPDNQHKTTAQDYTIRGFNRLTLNHNNYKVDMEAIKQNLAQGAPVTIGMQVGGTFMELQGEKVWKPTQADYNMRGFGGHAMTVIGYDENLQGGSFQIMNSWGPYWGDKGNIWVRYKDFDYFVKEAYGLYPMGDARTANKLAVEFGLVDNESGNNIPMERINGREFKTTDPLQPRQKFKIEVTNQAECYTYVFGQETDGSSYVLFPYTNKHSPFCGIVGTRLFPKDHSLYPDSTGTRDYMAIVVSKKQLKFDVLNDAISEAPGRRYVDKVNNALQAVDVGLGTVNFRPGQTIGFEADITEDKFAVGVVLEISK